MNPALFHLLYSAFTLLYLSSSASLSLPNVPIQQELVALQTPLAGQLINFYPKAQP